jgi:PucR C-terminal helix-turn-helix domain/GGDEF-like domain
VHRLAARRSVYRVIDEVISKVAERLRPRSLEITQDLHRRILGDIPELRGDERIVGLLDASIDENVAAILHVLQHEYNLDHIQTPLAALEYTRRLAQHGVRTSALLRAYRIGHERFLGYCLDELTHLVTDVEVLAPATLRMTQIVFGYIDRVSEQVVAAYEIEQGLWLQNRVAVRAACIRSVLSGDQAGGAAIERTLRYRLRQWHLGLVLWVGGTSGQGEDLVRFEKLSERFAQELGCGESPLFVPSDDVTALVWLPLGDRQSVRAEPLEALLARQEYPPRVATGEPAYGVEGWRATHRQALRAQSVAVAAGTSGRSITRFGEVGPIAMMCDDLEATRAWVHWTLGRLAEDDDQHAGPRETLRVFLSEGASYTAAAERLKVHKNTIQYRVNKAADVRGRGWDDGRLDVELALLACRWLGPAVLARAE